MKTAFKQPRATAGLLDSSILKEQIELELEAVSEGAKRYRMLATIAVDKGMGASLKPAERLLLHWLKPLESDIRAEKRALRRREKNNQGQKLYAPLLLQIDATTASAITLYETLNAVMQQPDGVPVVRVAYAIGRAITAEINYAMLRKEASGTIHEMQKEAYRRARRINVVMVNSWAKKKLDNPVWNKERHIALGVRLLWSVIATANCKDYDGDDFAPAFRRVKRRDKKRLRAYLETNSMVFDIIDDGHHARSYLRPRYLPMIVQPYPWQADAEGGYVKIRTPFVSKPSPTHKKLLASADLANTYECLNALSATPWRVNKRIAEVARAYWDGGGGLLGIPPQDDPPIPDKPADVDTNDKARAAWARAAGKQHRANKDMRGIRMEFVRSLHVVDRMDDRTFYLPHQLDFRGRAYPVPPHLNHHGYDLKRGLMEFSRAVPVSDRGMFWIKVHAANCWGFDKASFNDRAAWTEAKMSEIEEWAANPLIFEGWHEADDPWQFLAACFALTDDDAASHLPVQLDGTCNGLQHYAAIGRDIEGAKAVNLLPAEQPEDIYGAVAKIVSGIVDHEAKNGNEIARVVAGLVDRKLAKPIVMTSVYGVTMVGARKAVSKRLDEAGIFEEYDNQYDAAIYLSRVTMESLEAVCRGATEIMAWLADCAHIISDELKQPVQWETPIGFPVVQPYRRYGSKAIKTIGGYINTLVPDDSVPVRMGKQVKGLPPNYIHSIDSTHMLMTARQAYKDGLDFAAVHDSFWSHAEDVDVLASTLRSQFVDLHQRDLLGDLKDQFTKRYEAKFPDPPARGNLNIEAVHGANYFFS